MTPRFTCLFSASVFLVVGAARAGDWTEFRGPTGQGIVRDGKVPLEWAPGRNVTWKQDVAGTAWSSPVVVAGRVYLTTAVPAAVKGAGNSLRTLCLDAKTGKEVWNIEIFTPAASHAHPKNSQASPTPIFADGRLYVHFGHMGTACLDADGKIVWKQNDVKYSPVHGNGGSPVLVGDSLIFSCDGGDKPFVIALDRNTGKVLWKTPRTVEAPKTFSFSTPLVIEVQGKKQVVLPGSNAVCAYDAVDGKEIWRVRYKGYSVIPRPVFGHGLVYLSSGFDSPTLLAIRTDGSGDVTDTHIAWTVKKAAPLTPSPLLDGDELYTVADNGWATCFDAKTGKVHWSENLKDTFSSSPVLASGRIYCLSEKGKTYVLQAGKSFKELACNDLSERDVRFFASLAVADGALFLRTETSLYRIEEK